MHSRKGQVAHVELTFVFNCMDDLANGTNETFPFPFDTLAFDDLQSLPISRRLRFLKMAFLDHNH